MAAPSTPFLPNLKMRARWYLAPANQLPPGQVIPLLFDVPGVAALDTEQVSQTFAEEAVIFAASGNSTQAAAGSPGNFRVQIYHAHGSNQRQWMNTSLPAGLVLGTGQNPARFRGQTYFVAAGDILTVEVSNLANVPADIQVVLWAVLP